MPKTESNNESLLTNGKWVPVSAKHKTLVISYTLLPATIAIIAKKNFSATQHKMYLFFFPPPRSPTRLLG